MAGRLPTRELGKPTPARRRAVVGLGLRFARRAPPFRLRRAVLLPRPTTLFNHDESPKENKREEQRETKNEKNKRQKGDTFNEIRTGTFLMGLDTGLGDRVE